MNSWEIERHRSFLRPATAYRFYLLVDLGSSVAGVCWIEGSRFLHQDSFVNFRRHDSVFTFNTQELVRVLHDVGGLSQHTVNGFIFSVSS